ncbi:MAG: hypothetical protein M1817_006871 [Caeruleum heppii]|nr:MAG: hypothetical protein M1817_006871 [Caeruleum heppii]
MAPPTDPHQGGDLSDMAATGTTIPSDAGTQRVISSVPNPAQQRELDAASDPSTTSDSLAGAATNRGDMPRRTKDVGQTGEVLTGTGDQLPASVESKRLNVGAEGPLSKGHPRYEKHVRQKESDVERLAGEGAGVDDVPGEEELEGEEQRERKGL